ncbi:MAG: 50S ribosomal protein L10 [Candidatus Enterosoma sp.]|nr:50S ribosomal protein L10 [Bacilli bacterium]MDD7607784.1 50S ribosomal protein L10 [bacterium]MDY3907670.1 50S ribosomal protein L10 [Candidatus Enterosoma sp.]MDY5649747.1 50S ribosomal protein L10 [Candidatus Enterosoma sp.]MDY5865716.1 50S ribosomal protein L10 [Candidatus Enterosoma sp.]
MNQQILAEKKKTVEELTELIKGSHSTVVVSYSGLAVSEVNKLRSDLKKVGCRLSVQKNTLMRKACDADGLSQLDSCFTGQNGIVTSKEEGQGLGVLKSFKDAHKEFTIKGGIIDGTYCDEQTLNSLASVGSKENAISIFLSTLQSPLVLFALTLKAVGEKAN